MEAPTTYVSPKGLLFDASYLPLNVSAPAAVPFPVPQSFASESEFLDAVNEWVKLVDVSLNKAVLPVGVSRVYCRPRFDPSPKSLVTGSSAPSADDTDEASDVSQLETGLASPRSGRSSPRAAAVPPRVTSPLVSPRVTSPRSDKEAAPAASQAPPLVRGVWRATLIPAVPAVSSDEATLQRWARLVEEQRAALPPHPRELAELLGIGNRLIVDRDAQDASVAVESRADSSAPASLSASTASFVMSSSVIASGTEAAAARRSRQSVWNDLVIGAERGWVGQPAPMASVRAAMLADVAAQSLEISSNSEEAALSTSAQLSATSTLQLKRAPPPIRGSTPILSRIRPSTPQQRRLPPAAPPMPPRRRVATNERIAVVDLFDSDDEESDSVEKEDLPVPVKADSPFTSVIEEEISPETGLVSASLLTIDPVPDVGKLGTVKSAALARLRACRLLGNLFVMRTLRAKSRGENFFRVPVTARIKASVALPPQPVMFSRDNSVRQLVDIGQKSSIYRLQNNPDFEETLLNRGVAGVVYVIPETELVLDLALLSSDEEYVQVMAGRARCLSRDWALSTLLSSRQRPGKYVSFEEVKISLLRLVSTNARLTPERLRAWLSEQHYLDYWISLLQVKIGHEVVLVGGADAKEEKTMKGGSTFGSLLFEGACFCLGDKSVLSGVLQLRNIMNDTNMKSVRACLAALCVYQLPNFAMRLLPGASGDVLHFVCLCFSICCLDPPRLIPYVAGIESELARGNSDASKFYRFLYVDYYLEYLEQFKGTSELSNDAYIGVRGVRATHLDALSGLDVSLAPFLLDWTEQLLRFVCNAGSSPVLALHATFVLSRLVGRQMEVLVGAGDKTGLALLLFSAAGKLRSVRSKMLFGALMKRILSLPQHVKLFNSFYTAQVGVLMGHLTAQKSNMYVDMLLVPLAQSLSGKENSMMFASASKNWGSGLPTSAVFNCVLYAVLNCESKSEDIRNRLMTLLFSMVKAGLLWIDIPSDLGALVVLAGKLSDHDGAHMLLAALSMILASSSSARNSFHPEGKCRAAWRLLCDLCRGANVRYVENASASSSEWAGADSTASSKPVAQMVHAAAFGVVESYIRWFPDAIPALISSRLLGMLLSAVAPHSPAGVAANALIVLSNLLTLQPGEDVRVREREVKPLVAFLAEKRFAVQVHLLYKKQGGDKPRNMFALMKWALTALSSPLAKDMLSKESDGEYLRELQQIAQINKKQQL